jgi:hypothetical protein
MQVRSTQMFGWQIGFALLILALVPSASLGTSPAPVVSLAWNPSSNSEVAGYFLSYGNSSGVYDQRIDAGTNTTVSLTNLVLGVTYFFVVKAYNLAGVESDPSNEISYLVPYPIAVHSLVLEALQVTKGLVTLSWNTEVGRIYQVEYQDRLGASVWIPLGMPVTAIGVTAILNNPISSSTKRFYRVVLLPPTYSSHSTPPRSQVP